MQVNAGNLSHSVAFLINTRKIKQKMETKGMANKELRSILKIR